MILPNYFIMKCNKPYTLIFRKEKDFYITFNPIDLEYYKLNITSTQILYLISQNKKLHEIVNIMEKIYNVSKENLKNDIIHFINSFPCYELIRYYINKNEINFYEE